MTRILCLTLALAVLITTGCSSASFVGKWNTQDLPDKQMPDNAESLTLIINNDQTFIVVFEDGKGVPVAGLNGTWEQTSKEQATFNSTRGVHGVGQLLDDSTLLTTSDSGVAVKLDRVK